MASHNRLVISEDKKDHSCLTESKIYVTPLWIYDVWHDPYIRIGQNINIMQHLAKRLLTRSPWTPKESVEKVKEVHGDNKGEVM